MSHCEELNQARRKLFEGLGESTKQYCHLMKLWFSMKITKEEFDLEARKLMTMEQTHLHNEFLLSLFSKCKGLATDSRKTRPKDSKKSKSSKQKKNTDKANAQSESRARKAQNEPYRCCMEEFFLPDQSLVLGRFLLTAWEAGLEGADEKAAELLVHAVQQFLKNILTAVLAQRSGYRLRENRMIYSVGCPVPNPWLRNSEGVNYEKSESNNTEVLEGEDDYVHVPKIPLTQEELERREIYRLACANSSIDPPSKPPVTTFDIFKALQVHKSAIPFHSIYALNMDKMISSVTHPSYEEIETVRYLKKSKFLSKEDLLRCTSKLSR